MSKIISILLVEKLQGETMRAIERLQEIGINSIWHFTDYSNIGSIEPKTAFYDWLYINAIYKNHKDLLEEIAKYNAFSDIEFNPKKSINCQARTCAILVALYRKDLLECALSSEEEFKNIVYGSDGARVRQLSLF